MGLNPHPDRHFLENRSKTVSCWNLARVQSSVAWITTLAELRRFLAQFMCSSFAFAQVCGFKGVLKADFRLAGFYFRGYFDEQ